MTIEDKRVYHKPSKTWLSVDEETYREYDRKRTAFRKWRQSHHLCRCPKKKFWLCDMICEDCEFKVAGTILSLDCPGSEAPDASPLLNIIPDPLDYSEAIDDSILLQQLFEVLQELDPHADAIIKLWIDDPDISDRAIARELNIPQRTFADRMKRIRAELQKLLE